MDVNGLVRQVKEESVALKDLHGRAAGLAWVDFPRSIVGQARRSPR